MSEKRTQEIQCILAESIGAGVKVEKLSFLRGGSINKAAKVETNKGIFFAKWNDARKYPRMFESEAQGLQLLANTGKITIPEIIVRKTIGETDFLILEFIEGRKLSVNLWLDFGKSLARLHKHTAEKFGLDHNNHIGSLTQSNTPHESWVEFFILERLEPQIKLAKSNNVIGELTIQHFNKLFNRLIEIFPNEKPSLLHGDLWNGNYLVGNNGKPVLIDPAVYFGHREMDIAMTRLFGGFEAEFYHSYNEEFPLQQDWEKRVDICNLYPLMVHINLFGGSYVSQVEDILSQF